MKAIRRKLKEWFSFYADKGNSSGKWIVRLRIFRLRMAFSNGQLKAKGKHKGAGRWNRVKDELYRIRGGKCEWCGTLLRREEISVHHIIPVSEKPELRFDTDNLMVMCRKCHSRIHSSVGRGEAARI